MHEGDDQPGNRGFVRITLSLARHRRFGLMPSGYAIDVDAFPAELPPGASDRSERDE